MPVSGKKIFPLPRHVAIIMDGNGRWARRQGLPRLAGHRAGTDNVRRIVEAVDGYGVEYLTLYAFSTENWRRPGREVNGILHILAGMIDRETEALHKNNVKLSHLGRLDGLSPALKTKVLNAVELTKNNSGMTLCIAFDYGGRAEILDAVRRIVRDEVSPEKIDEALFGKYLYTADVPEPDLIIRTGGEMRLSNFLIWQAAYSEFYTTPTLWPDCTEEDIEKAFIAYSQRERRFGGIKDEGEAKTD
ncbi:MAG: di-trans,poly-cis-decaprenylcistransferase [Dehalococcoidia bacterium]|nr:di-trans,poly-cis-decaprenylcistransferase [Dehalococcoidia bacterium]